MIKIYEVITHFSFMGYVTLGFFEMSWKEATIMIMMVMTDNIISIVEMSTQIQQYSCYLHL